MNITCSSQRGAKVAPEMMRAHLCYFFPLKRILYIGDIKAIAGKIVKGMRNTPGKETSVTGGGMANATSLSQL